MNTRLFLLRHCIFGVAFSLCSSQPLLAATINAVSLSAADVQAAINSSAPGDTVVLPAGTASWATTVTINKKPITIQGSGIGNTVITNTQTLANTGQGCAFSVTATPSGLTRITGIEFNGNRTSNMMFINGATGSKFRVDHCRFVEVRYRAIAFSVLAQGLVDHCEFLDCFLSVSVYAGSGENESWQLPLSLGTIDAVFIEDCTISYQNWYPTGTGTTFDAGQGSRRVIRHCTWTNHLNIGFFPIVDSHGNQAIVTGYSFGVDPPGGKGGSRGSRQLEMYDNTFTTDTFAGKEYRLVDFRGGTNIAFNNTYTGAGMNTFFRVREEDSASAFAFRTIYPGYDPLSLYFWNNFSNGTPISSVVFLYPEDPIFVIAGTNLFFSPLTPYTPYQYPHPFQALTSPVQPPSNARVNISVH